MRLPPSFNSESIVIAMNELVIASSYLLNDSLVAVIHRHYILLPVTSSSD